ncbi:MAG: pyridoxamine 5'-phosphate oxidase family protein, partial [Pseudomonadota bacterium]
MSDTGPNQTSTQPKGSSRPSAFEPDFYNDLDLTLSQIWRRLERGVADRRSPFHTPTVATMRRADGLPNLRTVVLRACEHQDRQLTFHTDARSEKCRELRANPAIALHVYDPQAKI